MSPNKSFAACVRAACDEAMAASSATAPNAPPPPPKGASAPPPNDEEEGWRGTVAGLYSSAAQNSTFSKCIIPASVAKTPSISEWLSPIDARLATTSRNAKGVGGRVEEEDDTCTPPPPPAGLPPPPPPPPIAMHLKREASHTSNRIRCSCDRPPLLNISEKA